jgi:hypothetical protein
MTLALWATVIIGAFTILIAFIQMDIMRIQREIMEKQTELMNRQLTIAEEQAAIVLRQLSQVAELEMSVALDNFDQAGSAALSVYVENKGTKSANGFTWHLGVQHLPGVLIKAFSVEPVGQLAADPLELEGRKYRLFKHRVHSDLYKGRMARVCRLQLLNIQTYSQISLLFQVTWNEGEFPGGGYRVQVLKFVSDGQEEPT